MRDQDALMLPELRNIVHFSLDMGRWGHDVPKVTRRINKQWRKLEIDGCSFLPLVFLLPKRYLLFSSLLLLKYPCCCRFSWDAKMDVRTSIVTGRPMLLGLETAKRNFGLVMKLWKFVKDIPVSVLLAICPPVVSNGDKKGLEGKKFGRSHRVLK